MHEYLLLKGVECAAIHGGKDQEDRMEACRQFRGGEKDVLGKHIFANLNNVGIESRRTLPQRVLISQKLSM